MDVSERPVDPGRKPRTTGLFAPFGPPDGVFDEAPADVGHIRRKWLDLPYATASPSQRLDIYLPEDGPGPFPVLIVIHGGAFAFGDKRDLHVLPHLSGLERGYAVASLNYRLSGEAVFPAGLRDVRAGIRWLRAHASDYQLDAGRLVVWGASSGGNYAAMVAVSASEKLFDDPEPGPDAQPCHVQVAIDWFGPTDFRKMDAQLAESGLGPTDHGEPWSPESVYLGDPIHETPEKARLADPTTYVHPGMCPILIQHGRQDRLVPYQQSVLLAEAIAERVGEGRYELDLFEDAGHDDPIFASEANLRRVFEFIDENLDPR